MPKTSRIATAPVLLVALCLCLGATGCQFPEAIRTYEYLHDYDRMTDAYDPYLSLVYLPDPEALRAYSGIVIGDVDLGKLWIEDREMAVKYAEQFVRPILLKDLVQIGAFEVVSQDPVIIETDERERPFLRLDARITVFALGSGWRRYWSYWLWFLADRGATDLQIEGRVTDARTGVVLAEVADRRRLLIHTVFGPHRRASDDKFAMSHTFKQTLLNLAHLVSGSKELQPESDDAESDPEQTPSD